MKNGRPRRAVYGTYLLGSLLIVLTGALPILARAETLAPSCEAYLAQPAPPSANLAAKVAIWKNRQATLPADAAPEAKLKLHAEISDYAAELIRNQRNDDFFWLAGQVEFALNPHAIGGKIYGSSLLEAAILAKNYPVYKKLTTLANESHWASAEVPQLETWSAELVKTVMNDSVFYKDSLSIKVGDRSEFALPSAPRGFVSPEQLARFEQIAKTKDVQALTNLLTELYPNSTMKVKLSKGGDRWLPAELDFFHSQLNQGNPGDYQRLRVRALEQPAELRFTERKMAPVPRKAQFSLQIEATPVNWIREMKVTADTIRIVIERDPTGQRFDGGDRYEALVLHRSADGKIERIEIGDGNHLLFRRLWTWTEVFTGAVAMFTGSTSSK